MTHKSENCLPLKIIEIQPDALEDNYQTIGKKSNVYFLHLSTIKQCKLKEISNLKDYLISFANELDDKSVYCPMQKLPVKSYRF
jgi:site-specific DNA-methyltransferase (adenine-specific)